MFNLTKYNPRVRHGYFDRPELESGYICGYLDFQSRADKAVQISIVAAKTIFPDPDWTLTKCRLLLSSSSELYSPDNGLAEGEGGANPKNVGFNFPGSAKKSSYVRLCGVDVY